MDSEAIKEEIRRRIKLDELVSQYVDLQRAGSRLRGRCPFHQEKTPSFYVSPDLGVWKCFGCGAGGDLFSFVMKIEGLTFPEAAERLAERCGLVWHSSPGDEARSKRRQTLRRANAMAADYFEALLRSEAGRPGLEYLRGRQFSDETIRKFRLGYALESWDGLLRHLRQKGVDESLAAEAGLTRARDGGGHYDVFRNRVMFPIIDVSERVIGFGGRALSSEDPAKYLNTSDTSMFHKGQNVYAIHLARPAMTREKSAVIVEGYTDVLALHQAGIENVVACLGTALTKDHLDLLSRYVDEIILAYDADAAGMNAAARNIPMLEACTAEVKIVILPPGLDPDECVKRDGAEGFRRVLANRTTPVEYEIQLKFARHEAEGPEGATRAAQEAVDVLLRVPDRTRRDRFIAKAADLWGRGVPGRVEGMERALRLELERRGSQRTPGISTRRTSTRDRTYLVETVARSGASVPAGLMDAQRELLCWALSSELVARQLCQRLTPAHFTEPAYREVADRLANALQEGRPYSAQVVLEGLPEDCPARAAAAELALQEVAEVDEEVLRLSIENLIQYRQSGGHTPTYSVPAADDVPEPQMVEDFQALQARVVAKVNSGAVDPDDPDMVLYKTLMARLHGKGGLAYATVPGAVNKETATPQIPMKADFPKVAAGTEQEPEPADEYGEAAEPEDPFDE